MTYEQFLLILDNYNAYCEAISDAYDVGIDLLEGKFATNSYVEKMLELFITSHYGEMGWDWVSWFIYENDYGQKGLEAWDALHDGGLICQTHKELHEYLEITFNTKDQ
jgi:hypothetical protein